MFCVELKEINLLRNRLTALPASVTEVDMLVCDSAPRRAGDFSLWFSLRYAVALIDVNGDIAETPAEVLYHRVEPNLLDTGFTFMAYWYYNFPNEDAEETCLKPAGAADVKRIHTRRLFHMLISCCLWSYVYLLGRFFMDGNGWTLVFVVNFFSRLGWTLGWTAFANVNHSHFWNNLLAEGLDRKASWIDACSSSAAPPPGASTNIHYTGLTDLTWSPCGTVLVVSSSDGFCSIVTFSAGELGELLPGQQEVATKACSSPAAPLSSSPILHSPSSPAPASLSPAPVLKAGPKRLQFVTLSSPKAEKKGKEIGRASCRERV